MNSTIQLLLKLKCLLSAEKETTFAFYGMDFPIHIFATGITQERVQYNDRKWVSCFENNCRQSSSGLFQNLLFLKSLAIAQSFWAPVLRPTEMRNQVWALFSLLIEILKVYQMEIASFPLGLHRDIAKRNLIAKISSCHILNCQRKWTSKVFHTLALFFHYKRSLEEPPSQYCNIRPLYCLQKLSDYKKPTEQKSDKQLWIGQWH